MKKVVGHSDLRRTSSGAIISVNKTELERAKAQKRKDQELINLRSDVDQLKEQINILNNIIQELINGR